MLTKVLKYDLKMVGRELFPIYLALFILALLSKVFNLLAQQFTFLTFLSFPIQALYYITLVGSFFATFFLCIKRYYKNIFKDEGYLTNTLPVSKNSILLSKVLLSLILLIANILLAGRSLWIVLGNLGGFWNMISVAFQELSLNPLGCVLFLIFLLISSYMSYTLVFFVSIALGHTSPKDKLTYSIIYGIAVYMIFQFVSLVCMLPIFLANMDLLTHPDILPPASFIIQIFVASCVLLVVEMIACYIVTKYTLTHKLNLD